MTLTNDHTYPYELYRPYMGTSWTTTWYNFTTSTVPVIIDDPMESKPPEKRRKVMTVYILFLVDAIENEILLGPVFCIAKNESSASTNLDLNSLQKKAVSRGDYAIVVGEIGDYEPREISYVRNK